MNNSIIAFSLLILSGCTQSKYEIINAPSRFQNIRYINGIEITESAQINQVSIALESKFVENWHLVGLAIHIKNNETLKFDFGPENVSVKLNGSDYRLVPEEEMINNVLAKSRAALFWIGLSEGLSGANLKYKTSLYQPGNVVYVDRQPDQAYNILSREISRARHQNVQNNIFAQYDSLIETIQQTYLKKQTVDPSCVWYGMIYTSPIGKRVESEIARLEFTIRVGSEKHILNFDVKSIK